jgi:release factor glutamine methyltransferase
MDFGPLRISYDARVLRPRPWTLHQSSWAAELATTAPPGALLELCCGAGQIDLATAAQTRSRLVCVDVDPVACEYTRLNAELAGLAELLEVRAGLLDERVGPGELFAGVIADPPWVPREEVVRYPEDPVTAIDGGPDGLDLARACIATAARHLLPGGFAVVQIGTRPQADQLIAELGRYDGLLRFRELREFDRGTLMRLDRLV